MVTDISIHATGPWGGEDRSWSIGEHGFDATLNAPLDFTTFTDDNFADGTVKSGCVLGQVTATGKFGPYDDTAIDGRAVAIGMLMNSFKIPTDTSSNASDAVVTHFVCRAARLPYATGAGALDANARTDLKLVIFT